MVLILCFLSPSSKYILFGGCHQTSVYIEMVSEKKEKWFCAESKQPGTGWLGPKKQVNPFASLLG